MLFYEIKKILVKSSSRIALLFLLLLLGTVCYFAVSGVEYVNEKGESEVGISAVHKIKELKKQWAGELTEEKIAAVIKENNRINRTEEGKSDQVQKKNIAYGWKQGISDIRALLVYSFGKFREYDYYLPDSLTEEDAGNFYENRILHLEEWLDTEAKEQFSAKEKAFLTEKYRELKTPMYYDYAEGFKQLFEFAPTIIMITVMVLGFLTANIFSGEFQLRADDIFYSSFHGRGKAVWAKIGAGFLFVTVLYWLILFLYSAIVLGILESDGAELAIQTGRAGWKSFYNITYGQEFIIILLGGYIGTVFITFLVMLVSAAVKSAVLAAAVPFILIFLPTFLYSIESVTVTKIVSFLPDQLLQMNQVAGYFNICEIGGILVGMMWVLPMLYAVLSAALPPLLYRIYKKRV